MPDAGLLTEDLVAHAAPILSPAYGPPPWKLPGARMLRVLFETDKEPLLTWLPPKLTRSSPPYAMISIEQYPVSPVGPFALATQYIGCRAGFFIRAFALQSIVNSVAALAALREAWGMPCQYGEVSLSRKVDKIKGNASRDGHKLVRVRLEEPEEIEPDLVRIDPVLCLRVAPSLQENVRHDLIQLVQLDPEYEIKASSRGHGKVSYPKSVSGGWSVLPCRNVVSAVYCELDTELPLARFVIPY